MHRCVCQNEGVYTILDLLKVKDLTRLSDVNGLTWRQDNHVLTNESSPVVPKKDLEKICMAWHLLPSLKKYRTRTHGLITQKNGIVYKFRLSYKCSFCMINIINRTDNSNNISSEDSNIFRWWSLNLSLGSLITLQKMGVKNVKIGDELFVLNPNHFMKICDMIIERGYDFNIYSRVDTCKPKYLEKLQKIKMVRSWHRRP